MLFAKPKSVPSDDPAAVFKTDVPKPLAMLNSALAGVQSAAGSVLRFLKTPFVAPGLVLLMLLSSVVLFFTLAGDPDGASPTVRVALPHAPGDPHPVVTAEAPAEAATSGQQAFNLDSIGLFNDPAVQGFATADPHNPSADTQGGMALITLPGGAADAPTVALKPASPLAKAPLAGLTQPTPDGPLPIIGANGLAPSAAYARPFRADGRPMVALVIGGLGLNPQTTRAAIEQLPPEITLSFVPYTQNLQNWIDQARSFGHEVLIEVPMQPVNYPDNDPGPLTLMANARPDELSGNLNKVLSRATGYFGVINYQGSAFLKDKVGVSAFMGTLKTRGLSFIDDGQARGLPGTWGRASAERIVDDQITGPAIAAQLNGLEVSARSRGSSLGTGFAYPVTLAVALKWAQGLDKKGLQLVPASAISHK